MQKAGRRMLKTLTVLKHQLKIKTATTTSEVKSIPTTLSINKLKATSKNFMENRDASPV